MQNFGMYIILIVLNMESLNDDIFYKLSLKMYPREFMQIFMTCREFYKMSNEKREYTASHQQTVEF